MSKISVSELKALWKESLKDHADVKAGVMTLEEKFDSDFGRMMGEVAEVGGGRVKMLEERLETSDQMVERVDRQTMANHGAATSKYRGMSVAVDLSEAMDAASLVGVHSVDEPGMG